MSAQPLGCHAKNGRTALVVDDDHDCLVVLQNMLQTLGFTVCTAQDGSQALAQLGTHELDIVFLDIMMPGMDGLETLEQIRNNPATARLPVVLLSAKSGDEDMLAGYQCGADYYITKPCTARQLQYGITLVLGKGEDKAITELGSAAAPTSQ